MKQVLNIKQISQFKPSHHMIQERNQPVMTRSQICLHINHPRVKSTGLINVL